MNHCLSCGSNVNPGEKYCRVCGARLVNNEENMEQFQMPITNNDDILVDAFMGEKANSFKTGSFSVYAFLFGAIYALYRKMWLVGITWLFIGIISTIFLKTISGIISLVVNLYICYQFNTWYINHAREQVKKIKENNPGKGMEELMNICKQKGGTTIFPIIILVALYLIIIVAAIIAVGSYSIIDSSTGNKKLNNLSYTIPENYVSKQSNLTTKIYSKITNEDICSLRVNTMRKKTEDITSFYEQGFFDETNYDWKVIPKNINNNTWYFVEIPNNEGYKYYYNLTSDGNFLYLVSFTYKLDQNKTCEDDYNSIINSLEIG